MVKIRKSVFETNSSMTHAVALCLKEEYDNWSNGESYFDMYKKEFISKVDLLQKFSEAEDRDEYDGFDAWRTYNGEGAYESRGCTLVEYDTYLENIESELAIWYKDFTTPEGEEVTTFGYAYHAG